jgi:hypothetical protein
MTSSMGATVLGSVHEDVERMTQRERDKGTSGKIILFVVLGVFPVIFLLLVFLLGPMLGLRFGA